MATRRIRVKELVCDGCGSVTYEATDSPAFGIRFVISILDGYGSRSTDDVFACRESCVEKAVNSAVGSLNAAVS